MPTLYTVPAKVSESRIPAAVLTAFRKSGKIAGPKLVQQCRPNADSSLVQTTEYRTPLGWDYAKQSRSAADLLNGVSKLERYTFTYTDEIKNGVPKTWYTQCTPPTLNISS